MAGGNSLALVWDLIARDGASPAFDRVAVSANRAAASTEAAAVKTEAAGAALSRLAKVGAVAGVAFAAAAVKMASDFQQQMTLVQTQAGSSAAEVRKMTPAILSLSGQVAQAPEALATSLYHVESTGMRGATALNAVRIAAEGATVAHADLEETTNALTAVLASGIVPATESFSQAMGQLNTIVGSGDMKLSDLNDALGTGFLVQVKQYGVTLNDVGAALADFGDNNIRGADAATMLRMAVQAIAKPGVDAESALGRIGLTVEQLQSDEQTGGLNKALSDLHTHLVNSGIDATQWGALMTEAFTKKAGGGIVTLIGTFDRFKQKYEEVSKGGDSFGDAWAATTKTAAFQANALKDNIESMTVSVGMHLLPAVTGLLHWVNGTAVPGLQHLGSGVLNVAHWFGELPGPIRDTALALGGLALANAIGLTGVLAGGVTRVGTAFASAGASLGGFSDKMAVQTRLAQMEAASLSSVDAALGGMAVSADAAAASLSRVQMMQAGWDTALAATAVEEDAVAVSTGRLSAAMATMSVGAQRAGSGLLSALGGGAGLAIGATILLLPKLIEGFNVLTGNVIDSTAATQGFTEALQQTNGAIDANVDKTVVAQLNQNGLSKVLQAAGVSAKDAVAGIEGNAAAQERVNHALNDYLKAQGGGGAHNAQATAAMEARDAYNQLSDSFTLSAESANYFAGVTGEAASNTGAAGQAATDAASQLEFLGVAANMSKDEIDAANKEWEGWIKNLSGLAEAFADPLQTYQTMLQQKQQAEQESAQATAEATSSSTDSWKDYVKNVGVSLDEYATKLEDELTNEQNWKDNLVTIAQRGGVEVAQQFAAMGIQGADLTAQMANATNDNFSRMATDMVAQATAGGAGAAAALDQQMRFMAEYGAEGGQATVKAMSDALGLGLNDVAALASQYGITLATGFEPVLRGLGKPPITVQSTVTRIGVIGHNADGGLITGPGTGRSDSILSYLSNGEFVVNAAATAQHRPLLEAINSAPRFADGGFASASDVPHPYSTAPYGQLIAYPSDATMSTEYDAAVNWLKANVPTISLAGVQSTGPVQDIVRSVASRYGWGGGPEWDALAWVIQHESGWRPTAQNPTSTAYGLFQFLDSTWASTHFQKTSDPAQQAAAGLSYISSRYKDPIGAQRFWAAHHWYDDGGWLQPGLTMAYNGTGKPERVRTAEQEAALQGGSGGDATFHLYDADGVLMGTMRGHAQQVVAGAMTTATNRTQYSAARR